MNWVQAGRRRAVALYLLTFILAAAGIYLARGLPASIFPSVTFPSVKVIASVGEEPAARMMPMVTRPLEEAILRVPGIQLVRSTTSRGSTEISAQFAWGTNMQSALQRVEAEGQRILPSLPPKTAIDVEWMNPSVFPILGYALTSEKRTQAELLEFAEFTLKPALFRVPGVAQVQIQGGRRREFQVRLNRQALESRRLAAADVVKAIQTNNQTLSAGLTEQNHELYLTLVDGRARDLKTLGDISVPVPGPDGGLSAPVRLSELGELTIADEVSYIRTTANGRPAVLVNILRQPSANTTAIADGIQQLVGGPKGLIPSDVNWSTFYDQAAFVKNSVGGARDAILIGVALAALVLLVFLKSFRLTFIAVAAILLVVAIVFVGLALTHQTINLMTLAGIAAALGLIADDAIVVIESIYRHAEEGAAHPAETALKELFPALVGSSLSTTIILLPFALLSGLVGAFFKPLAITMALVLVVSFVMALIAVPVSVALFGLPHPKHAPGSERTGAIRRHLRSLWQRAGGDRAGRLAARLEAAVNVSYNWLSRLFIEKGYLALGLTALLMAGAYLAYRAIGTDFLPKMDEGSVILDYRTPPGTSLTDTNEMLSHVEQVILSLPDVQSYSRRTGTQLGFFITEPNRGDFVILLKARGQRRPVEVVIAELRSRIASVEPAVHADFGQLLEDNIGDLTGGTPQPVDVKIFGDNQLSLEDQARAAARLVAAVPGVEDVFDGLVVSGSPLQIQMNPVAAARYGLTTVDLQAALQPAITGTVADQIRVKDRIYDLRVFANTGTPLARVPVRTPSGALISAGELATIATGKPETEIQRENLKTYVGVTARLGSQSLGAAMGNIRQRIATDLQLKPGQSIEYGGLYHQQQQSFRGLLLVLLGGLLLVSVVVLFEFADWRAPLVVVLSAIAVLAGVFLALHLTGQTLNISSFVGAIMMVGIVGENAIFVIHEAKLELSKGTAPTEAWIRSSRRRLRPVAMTILATGFALAPLALALGQSSQLMQPLAIAVIGGFILSGPAVLLLVPGMYRLLDPSGRLAPQRVVPLPPVPGEPREMLRRS